MSDRRMDYKGDDRKISMEELEKVLCDCYGWSGYDKNSGCSTCSGPWLSVNNVLKLASREAY